MKKTLLLVFLLLLLFAFAACAPAETTPPDGGDATPESEGAEGTEEATAGGEKQLIIAVNPDYESFDPAIAYEVYAMLVLHACYDNLFEFQDSLENLALGAAESYEVSEDGMTYTFKLKEGMVFASGNPMTSADVKWSFERGINMKGNGAFMGDGIVSIETPDDLTVVIQLSAPDPSFPTKLSYNVFSIMDSVLATEHGATNAENAAEVDTAKTWLDSNSAGSGPYYIESYTPKVEVVLARNENYYGEAPYYDKISIKTVVDSNTQVMMLQAGDVDIAMNVDPEQAKSLEGVEGIEVKDAQSLTVSFLLMNRDPEVGGPVADPTVQKAIRLALDYPGIQTIAGPGMVTPVAPFPIGLFGSLPAMDVSEYPKTEEALALMEEAGYADGFTVDFYVPTTIVAGVDFSLLSQKIQSDLSTIGIQTNIIPEDVTISLETYRTGKQPLGLWYWNPDYPDNNSQLAFLPGQSVGLRANWTADLNPELAELAIEAASIVDEDAREEAFATIQEMMQEDTPFACLLQHTSQYAIDSSLQGVEYIDRYKFDLKAISGE